MGLSDMTFEVKQGTSKEFTTIPEGTYTATITGCPVNETVDPPRINWEFTITDGEYSNRRVWSTQFITPKSQYFINRNLKPFGLEVKTPTDILDALALVVDKTCKVAVKHSKYKSPTKPEKVYYETEIVGTLTSIGNDDKNSDTIVW